MLFGSQTILAVLPSPEDRLAIQNILERSEWRVRFLRSSPRSRHLATVGAVLTEAHLPDGRGWKDILRKLEEAPNPPPLIVTDRLANEALWSEVLNLGGYDVLAKPFDQKEVLHVVSMACAFRHKHMPPASQTTTPQIAGCIAL
jgi:DNA-binding response OmpR family regulator